MRRFVNNLTIKDLKDEIGEVTFKSTKTGDTFDKKDPFRKIYPVLNCALVPCGFDIECYKEFMYIWTFTIKSLTVIGYTWQDFHHLLAMLKETLNLYRKTKVVNHKNGTKEEKESAPQVLPIFIHNLKYEWSFMRSKIDVSGKVFYMDKKNRNPMYILSDEAFLFIDSYKIYPMKLEEVAKCYTKTQKTHDLDYSKPRNIEDAKNLTDKELDYCCNDTVILSELAQYTFDTYFITYGRLPMTQNQIIKSIISYNAKIFSNETIKKELKKLTLSQDQYMFIRLMGFRGGWCHSSLRDEKCVIGYGDLTSAYFTAIMHKYFPMSAYTKPRVKVTLTNLSYFTSTFCCQMLLKFYNLRSSGDKLVKYESKTNVVRYMPDGSAPVTTADRKIMRRSVQTTSSGRIWKAACISVSMTEIDWEIYNKFYVWDKVEIIRVEIATRGTLPEYIKQTAISLYEKKAALKKAGRTHEAAYYTAKTLVNNVFGAIVQRLDKDKFEGSKSDWLAYTLDLKLKPQWGVYITAHVRKMLIDVVLEIGADDWLYSDTDSIYYIKNAHTTDVMNRYNKAMKIANKKICDEYNLDYSLFDDLGCFDDESKNGLHIYRFKTLGAKAYMYHYTDKDHPNGSIKLVLSGIPEEYFWEAYDNKYVTTARTVEEEIDRVFDFFNLNTEIVYKRNEVYYVENTELEVNGMLCKCETGCCIKENVIVGTIGTVREKIAEEHAMEDIDSDRV